MTDFNGKQSFLLTKGEPLSLSGFPVVPISRGLKFPKGLEDWQNTRATVEDVRAWGNGKFKNGGVGILTGNIIGVDIDLWHEDISRRMVDWCLNHIGHAPIRVGNRPKSLLVYKTDKPFRKCVSNQFRDQYDQLNRIEVLGVGQQFVAYAVHPDTNQPYEWYGEELADISPDQLTEITLDQIESMFGYFTLLVDEDWKQCGNQSLGRVVNYDQETVSGAILPGGGDSNAATGANSTATSAAVDGAASSVKSSGDTSSAAKQAATPGATNKASAATSQQRERSAEELLTNAKARLNLTDKQVRDTLGQLDADESYDLWTKVGMALYHQYDGDEKGLLLWDEWSKEGAKYEAGETQKKWRTFQADTSTNPVTMASIVKLAGKIKKESAGSELERFLEQFVYIIEGDRVCDLLMPPHVSVMKLTEFKNFTANRLHLVPAPTEKDPTKERWDVVWKAWMADGDRLEARGTKYLPDAGRVIKDDTGVPYINEYHIPRWERVDTTATEGFNRIMQHFQYQLEDDAERKWLMDWFAHIVQRPADRCLVTPLLVARAHGTGRGWFGSLIRKIVGSWNVSQCKFVDLTMERSNFNGFLNNTLVCEIGEVREAGRDKFQINDKVRDVLTEKELRVNNKFGSDKTQPVYTRFFMQSNHDDALAIEPEDRRIQVLTGPSVPMNAGYYDALYSVLDDQLALAEFYWWLMRRDISNFDFRRSSDTVGRRKMIGMAKTDLDSVFDLFETQCPVVAGTETLLWEAVLKTGGYSEFDCPFNKTHFRRILKEKFPPLGQFRNDSGVVSVEGKSYRVRAKRDLSNGEIAYNLKKLIEYVASLDQVEVEA